MYVCLFYCIFKFKVLNGPPFTIVLYRYLSILWILNYIDTQLLNNKQLGLLYSVSIGYNRISYKSLCCPTQTGKHTQIHTHSITQSLLLLLIPIQRKMLTTSNPTFIPKHSSSFISMHSGRKDLHMRPVRK